jgi:hypothetical protein
LTQYFEYGSAGLPDVIGNLQGKQVERFHEIRNEQKRGRATAAASRAGIEIREAYEQVLAEGVKP